jgi:hypothetical protein
VNTSINRRDTTLFLLGGGIMKITEKWLIGQGACTHNRRSICTQEYMELDDSGKCVFRIINKDILKRLKEKDPKDVTEKELFELKLEIEDSQQRSQELQDIHIKLVGRNYVPSIRL